MAPRRTMRLQSQSDLKGLFSYELETGKLFWKKRPREMFNSLDACKRWNSRFADREALTAINHGYRRGILLHQHVYAHQVIFKMMLGIDVAEVDHIDGDRSNNAWKNLRLARPGVNQRNCVRRRDNVSGHVGVVARRNKWIAQMGHEGTTKHIGIYDTKEDAIAARKAMEAACGFHPNHGRDPERGVLVMAKSKPKPKGKGKGC